MSGPTQVDVTRERSFHWNLRLLKWHDMPQLWIKRKVGRHWRSLLIFQRLAMKIHEIQTSGFDMDVGMSDTLGFFLTVSGKAMCFFEWRGIRSKVRRNFTRSGTEEFR